MGDARPANQQALKSGSFYIQIFLKELHMYMLTMTEEENEAYKWAMQQGFQSVAARYSKVLAKYIERNALELPKSGISQVIIADPGSTVQGVKQTIIK